MSPDPSRRLSLVETSGSPYEVGAALGRFGHPAVHGHLLRTPAWQALMAWRADPRVEYMATSVREAFPRYWAELQGLAAGLDLPFEDVFLWNCRGDIFAMAPDGCTTVQLPGSPHIIGHNEDGDPGFNGHCALARVASEGGNVFTTFIYPGSLPGHTFTVTSAGLVQAVNNLRPLCAGTAIPRMILTRATLDAPDLDAAIGILRTAPRAGAFHLTLAQTGDDRLLSIEFTSNDLSVVQVTAPGVHSNHLIHADIEHLPQTITRSSGERQRRAQAILGQTSHVDPQRRTTSILWDVDNPELPIHRTNPADEDIENTLASAVFRIGAENVQWSVYDRPDNAARFELRDVSPLRALEQG